MFNKVDFVDNYINYLINKYCIFTQEDDQTEIYDVELIKNLLSPPTIYLVVYISLSLIIFSLL